MAGESVLVVEDHPANLELLRILLEAEGYRVRTAADGLSALAAIAESRPRLILMDLQLPGMDGLEVTRKVKGEPAWRDAVVLALTAYTAKAEEEKARAAGCDGYVIKPFDVNALLATIAGFLRKGNEPERT